METNYPKVLISYTHDSPEHKQRVLELAERLRYEGVDCNIDQYEDSPPEGWPRWMDNQIHEADFVLVACTETYARRFRGDEDPTKGRGAQWEGFIITQDLFDDAGRNTRFIPILFSADDAQFIPKILRAATHYRVDLEEGYEDLYRRITAQPRVRKSPLGSRRKLASVNMPPVGTAGAQSAEALSSAPAERKESTVSNLALLFLSDSKFVFVPVSRIEHGDQLTLDLLPDQTRTAAFLADLQGTHFRPEMGVAFGNTALQGHVKRADSIRQDGREHFRVLLETAKDKFYSPLSEFTFNGYTPEDVAELRARRILLNDKPAFPRGRNRLDEGMIEHMISRDEGLLKNVISPLPTLFRTFQGDIHRFLEAARLMSILYLKLTGTIEHVFVLEFEMEGDSRVKVCFEGQRPARYANVEPHVISFHGVCQLT